MTPEDEKFERIAQRHIADLKKSSKAIVEDAAVRAAHKVMTEFAKSAHTEAKVEYHTTMIQCPHCDGSVRVQAQPYPDNFIDALKYDVAKRDSEAQQQEPVAWGVFDGPNLHDVNFTEEDAQEMVRLKGDGSVVKPLYTSPQPQMQPCAGRNCGSTNPNLHSAECFEDYEKATGLNQWQGLTDEAIWLEYQRFWPFHPADEPKLAQDIAKFARAIEAKLKEKNT